jgi:hypothetical protein
VVRDQAIKERAKSDKKLNVSVADVSENHLYSTPAEALKKVTSEFEYWSGKLTETSSQMAYALIGANWVIFGSLNGILGNSWAKWSLLFVVFALVTNLIGAWILTESLRIRVEYGESDGDRWQKEFDRFACVGSPWPFTTFMETTGKYMRFI